MRPGSGWSSGLRWLALGSGYMGTQVVWALYNAYLPDFYGRFITHNALIGLVMTIDNIASLTVQPYFGALSDRVQTRFGRRMPFLLVGVPLTAVFLALIPRAHGLAGLLAATAAMNVGISVYSSPAVALMPDVTPPALRGRANGVLMGMGGVGALLGFFVLSPLFDVAPHLPFDCTAAVLLVSLLLVALAVPEMRAGRHPLPRPGWASTPGPGEPPSVERGRLLAALGRVVTARDRRAFWLLLAAVGWVAAVNGAQNMFTRYGTEHLGLSQVEATFMLGYFAGPFILLSVPAGMVGDRWGPWRAIRAGSLGLLAAFAVLAWQPPTTWAPWLFALAGVAWALLMSSAYPVLVRLAPADAAGTYTGLWNLAIALAGVISPPVYGAAVDVLGWEAFFPVGASFVVLGLLAVRRAAPRPAGPPGSPGVG